ncbi:MAG: T9SS type A sorting domain-containing protein [Bacteroidetes bacterium]|nr:T9SS type A sorting domain-containing protein [Bacteroidota bacterium]
MGCFEPGKEATVSVYNIAGEVVRTYTLDSNYKELLIDSLEFSNGTYLCHIQSNDLTIANKDGCSKIKHHC